MPKFFFCLVLLCFLQKAESKPTGQIFIFTGKVENTPAGYVYLNYIDSANHYISDSCQLVNGRFEFSGYISGPVMATFKGKTAS